MKALVHVLAPILCAATLLTGCSARSEVAVSAPTPSAGLLAAFRPPPGAARLTGRPSDAPRAVDQPASESAVDNLRVDTGWWTTTGTPEQAAAWFTAHGPTGGTPGMEATGTVNGRPELTKSFDLPDRAGYRQRTLMLSAVAFHRSTLLRVDAMEAYVGVRTARDRVPAGTVRLVVRGSTPQAPKPTVLRTVTDPSLIRRVVALTNALPLLTPGVRHCPAATGGLLILDFYASASASARPIADLRAARSSCQDTTITTPQDPSGTPLEPVDDYETHILDLLRLR